jgi:predicted ATPase
MTKINKLSIQNFKILKNIENIELDNLNLITGINSSGKSTFIQSLLLLKENKELINQHLANKVILQNI